MKKPLIGVTPLYDGDKNSFWMIPGYMQGLEAAGAVPVMLPLTADKDELLQLAETCDGFLFTGGQDVSPELYGENRKPECGEECKLRDISETILFRAALDADKPVLGICRGIQFINAYLGGSLYQNLPGEHPSNTEHHMSPPYDRAVHNVSLMQESPLYELLGVKAFGVNSYHHQAIKTLAPKLCEMARSQDGLIEAVYMPDKKFVWAFQWHPELSYLTDEKSLKIFKAFVNAAI